VDSGNFRSQFHLPLLLTVGLDTPSSRHTSSSAKRHETPRQRQTRLRLNLLKRQAEPADAEQRLARFAERFSNAVRQCHKFMVVNPNKVTRVMRRRILNNSAENLARMFISMTPRYIQLALGAEVICLEDLYKVIAELCKPGQAVHIDIVNLY